MYGKEEGIRERKSAESRNREGERNWTRERLMGMQGWGKGIGEEGNEYRRLR